MIILTLGGGLGNQMFQYAFARKLQKLTGDTELKFSDTYLRNNVNSKDALFQLNIPQIPFCDAAEQEKVDAVQNRLLNRQRYYNKISKVIRGFSAWKIKQLTKKGIYTTHSVYDCEKYFLSDAPVKYVSGGYQTWRYWEDMMPEIRAELLVTKPASRENERMMEEMEACESVCVHIRRGDYLAPEFAHLNVCDETYYMTAMTKMAEQKPNAVFYIFTNNHKEIEWIKANYHLEGFQVRYVDLDNPDYEELRLMYHCKHFIISNSTFSWWGQFLSENEDKIVMAPSVWNRELNADDIYMPDWQIIQV